MAKTDTNKPEPKKFSRWFRKNERIFWAILLVVVVLAFGVTGVMSQVFASLFQKNVLVCGDNTYTGQEIVDLKRKLERIGHLVRPLNYKFLVQSINQNPHFMVPLATTLAAIEEADKLKLAASPAKIREIGRMACKSALAFEEYRALPADQKPEDQKAQSELLKSINDKLTLDAQAYAAWVVKHRFSVRDFEYHIGNLLKIVLLKEFYQNQDMISRKDIYDDFVKSNRKITLAFTRLNAADYLDQVTETFDDQAVEDFYNSNKDDFVLSDRIQFTCLKYPMSHFEKEVTITEEDMRKQYDRFKAAKYLKSPLGVKPEMDFPLTKEEQEKLDSMTYVPFDEVKEEIRLELTETRKVQKARTFGQNLLRKIAEQPTTEKKYMSDEEKKSAGKSAEDLAAQHDFVTLVTTPFFTRDNAEEKLDTLYSQSDVKRWFDAMAKDDKPLTPPKRPMRTPDEETLYVITDMTGEKSRQQSLAETRERIMNILKLDAASKIAEEKAQNIMLAVREGTPLSEAAPDQSLFETPTLSSENRGDAEIKMGEESIPDMVKNQVFFNFFYQLTLEDKTTSMPLQHVDKETDAIAWYVFALTGSEAPDARKFVEQEESLKSSLGWKRRSQRQRSGGWASYMARLTTTHAQILLDMNPAAPDEEPASSPATP